MTVLARTDGLTVTFPRRRSLRDLRPAPFVAVERASIVIRSGEITALVGESGSGKSTLARALLRLVPFSGAADVAGVDVSALSMPAPLSYRRLVQAVLQDPLQALNPRHDVAQVVGEPLEIQADLAAPARRARVIELLESVGLAREHLTRTSREVSGGQRQRVAIARAIALDPPLLILDEALSALDVTTAASVARLLRGLLRPDSAMLFIGHDLAMVRQLCDRVYVMRRGEIVDEGTADDVCGDPSHEYTKLLIDSIPRLVRDEPTLRGCRVTLPLEGIRIIEAATVLAAPLSSALLGELGAEVIKVEEPGVGDAARGFPPHVNGVSAYFKVTNRNKKSVTLDLRTPDGVDILIDLCRSADALVLNYRPSALERWGVTEARLREANPALVVLHLTAFGLGGPYSDHPGFGRVAEAFGGLTHITGEPSGPPYFPGYPVADAVGGYYGAFLLMVGLAHRAKTGEGQFIDIGLYEPILRMLEDFVVTYGLTGEVKGRGGNDQPHSCPNGIFPTADNQYIVLPASTSNMWARLLELLDDPDGGLARLDTTPKRVANRPAVNAAVTRLTSQHERDALVALLRSRGIACGTVNTVADICRDPHVAARGNIATVHDPEMDVDLQMQAPVGRFSTITTRLSPGPRLGEHTDEILLSLAGLTPQRLADLRRDGVA